MTVIRHRDGRFVVLTPYSVAGRSPEAHVRLTSTAVSFEHAAFHLLGDTWTLRDLGSRNGTFLNGRALERGVRAPLSLGDLICFGDGREEWRFEASSHVASSEHPLLLETSSLKPRTSLERVALRFGVSPDGKDVSLNLCIPSENHRTSLGARTGFHVLLFLARARLDDRARGVPPAEEGWRVRGALLDALSMTKNRLSVESHRLRQLLEQQGVLDASSLFEHRRGSDMVRIGVEHLAVE